MDGLSSANRSRVMKRMHHACENCSNIVIFSRRKKTRCPGERPTCSTCSRLDQACTYTDSHLAAPVGNRDVEGRLARLEEKMGLMLERTLPSASDLSESPKSQRRPSSSYQITPESARPQSSRSERHPEHPRGDHSTRLPPENILLDTIDLYFQYCHRQPLWLFERKDFSSLDDCCEEVIFSLLALTIRFSSHSFFDDRSQSRYAEIARGHIMFRIAQGTVQLSTIQSLCLLAFANFMTKDTHLAWLHINLANSLYKAADLAVEINHDEYNATTEAKRRMFYSIHLLNQLYGARLMMLNMRDDIENPRYLATTEQPEQDFGNAPPLTPRESGNRSEEGLQSGIWGYMVQQTSLWSEVRNYVAHCANSTPKTPWSPGSEYTVIGAHLMDMETKFPREHRYDAAIFLDRSSEELQRNRDYWSPWLYLQFAYHAVHNMLNHPFLYSSNSSQMTAPNTFWKTSSELAFIHATWTVRLIDMVSEKNYRVSDPFIGHCAAVAATIHLYYCHAGDSRVWNSAQVNMAKCMRFLSELGTIWPICQWMYEKLDALVQSAIKSSQQATANNANRRTISIKTDLMWDILDYTSPSRFSNRPGRGLFDPTLIPQPEAVDGEGGEEEGDTVETEIFYRPNSTVEVDTSNGGQELPPSSNRSVRRGPRGASRRTGHAAGALERLPHSQQDVEIPTWPDPALLSNNLILDLTNDSLFQIPDAGSPFMGFWGIGNL